ncbi:MAG: hypothetical protein DIU83_06190 [Bacillota bacterium]|nr:MAG: hypothetical protein DIU83_06190 [Bacillota bacterium]
MNMKSVVVVTHGDALRLGPPEAASHRAELWTPPGPERPNGHRLGWTTASAAPPVRPHDEPDPTTSPAQPSARPNTARPSHRPEGTFARQRGDATPGRGSDVPESLVIAIRSTVTFFTMLALTRVLGKRQLAQLNFFDYVFGITVGSIAASLSIEPDLKFVPTWLALLLWTFWGLVTSSLSLYSRRLRKLLDGEPTVVVQNGQILEGALKRLNYNLDDLRMQLRSQGVFSMGEVEFAIVEPGGQLSVLKKSQLLPATPADLNIPTAYKGPATELIVDGHIVHANLEQLGLTEAWLVEQVRGRGHEMADVYYAELDTQGNLYIDLHDDLQHVPQENKVSE